MEEFKRNVEKARKKAKETKEVVEVDGSRLSGIKSGDKWLVDETGIIGRRFDENEGLLEGLLQRRSERLADPDKNVEIDLLLKALAYAQWAPNATNEQPTKIMIYRKNHPSMIKIGELMHKALNERIVPNISIKNFIINRKKKALNFYRIFLLKILSKWMMNYLIDIILKK
jgi:hypothetical protein